jgi:hypothetical protein
MPLDPQFQTMLDDIARRNPFIDRARAVVDEIGVALRRALA